MSWNCAIAHVADTTLADLYNTGLTPHGNPVPAGDTTTMRFRGVAATQWRTGVVLTNSDLSLRDGLAELAARLQRTVTCATFAGISDIYMFEQYTPHSTRTLVHEAGGVLVDDGEPLDAEDELGPLDEAALFALLERVTGFNPDDTFQLAHSQPVTWPPTATAGNANAAGEKKRRWFRR